MYQQNYNNYVIFDLQRHYIDLNLMMCLVMNLTYLLMTYCSFHFRKQASLLAIHNAKQKAQDMARFVHQTIGHPITIREEECREWDGSCDMPYDPEKLKTRQELIVRATITASCKIYATFELKQKQKNKMKR